MKNKSAIILILSLCLLGCNKIPNKPIYEELSIKEIEKAMLQDTAFGEFYDNVNSSDLSLKMSPSQKAKYKNVTYRRLYEYLQYQNDLDMWWEKTDAWDKEWSCVYAKEIAETDSIINYWKEYKKQCNAEIDKYVKARISDIHYETEYYTSYLYDRVYGNGTRESRSYRTYDVTYTLYVPKIDKVNYRVSRKNRYERSMGWGWLGYDVNITKSDSVKNHRDGYSDYKPTDIWITEIIVDNKSIKSMYNEEDVPKSVRKYIDDENTWNWTMVAKEVVGNHFLDRYSYINQKEEEDLKAFDRLCFDFIEEVLENLD